ncbi:MAG: hypothetical protein KDJ62_15770 [Rhodobiaceae bacterium]|nr:hypothetical protein [Rhodobiaceae bacterium]MCC0048654.1 hypothetical protein [Rhodobiaceae bacterium]
MGKLRHMRPRPPAAKGSGGTLSPFLGTLLAALIAAIVAAFFSYQSAQRQSDVELVKVALSILENEPSAKSPPEFREWAAKLLDRASGQDIDETLRGLLKGGAVAANVDNPLERPEFKAGVSLEEISVFGRGGGWIKYDFEITKEIFLKWQKTLEAAGPDDETAALFEIARYADGKVGENDIWTSQKHADPGWLRRIVVQLKRDAKAHLIHPTAIVLELPDSVKKINDLKKGTCLHVVDFSSSRLFRTSYETLKRQISEFLTKNYEKETYSAWVGILAIPMDECPAKAAN